MKEEHEELTVTDIFEQIKLLIKLHETTALSVTKSTNFTIRIFNRRELRF
jgi:hypothetical protein